MSVGPYQVLIIVAVLVLLFGATKLPKLARSLGESARIFKAETKGLREDDKQAESGGNRDDSSSDTESRGESRQLPNSQQREPLDAATMDERDQRKSG